MALSQNKEIEIRRFLKGLSNENFIKFVECALEGWKIAIPMRGKFGISPDYLSETWRTNGLGCCLHGAALLNRTFDAVQILCNGLVTSEIIIGFDSPNDTLSSIRKHTTDQAIWAAKISKIIFD